MKVLIVDDHPIVLSGCRALLAEAARHGDAGGPRRRQRAMEMHSAQQKPDVTVIDINLPDVSGFELARRLLSCAIPVRAHPDVQHERRLHVRSAGDRVRRARATSARATIRRTFSTAIRAVQPGRPLAAARKWPRKIAFLRVGAGEAGRCCTPREREVLRLLAKGKSMSEIAALINVSYKTVATTCATRCAPSSAPARPCSSSASPSSRRSFDSAARPILRKRFIPASQTLAATPETSPYRLLHLAL